MCVFLLDLESNGQMAANLFTVGLHLFDAIDHNHKVFNSLL